MTFESAGAEGVPNPQGVMHAYLGTPQGYALMASDAPPGMPLAAGTPMSVSISGDEPDLLRGFFEQLSDGGTVDVPFETQMWGDTFGQCHDRFGVSWMVNASSAG